MWEDPISSDSHLLPAGQAEGLPDETFRGPKEKEERRLRGYRTRRLILEAWGKQ